MDRNDKEFLVQKIRTQYTEKEHTQLDALKELDAKVKRPANVFAAMCNPEKRKAVMQAERDEQIAEANKRAAEAQARIDAAKVINKNI